MDWASSDVIAVIWYLLPGFLAAWVFYGLTAHPRRDSFERVIQALIFTGIVQVLNTALRLLLLWASTRVSLGVWTTEVALGWSVVNAILVGLSFSLFANYGWLHWVLQELKITKRTSFPSEWYSAFNSDKRYIVLHLEGERRLRGWPYEWPDSAESGHFVMCDAAWLDDQNQLLPLHAVKQIVIPVTAITMIERLKTDDEMTASPQEVAAIEAKMIEYNRKAEEDGQQSTGPVSAESVQAGSNGQCTDIAPAKQTTVATPAAAQKVNKNRRK
jgi:hypothetical protein